jgi:hypothetical protein
MSSTLASTAVRPTKPARERPGCEDGERVERDDAMAGSFHPRDGPFYARDEHAWMISC